MTQKERGHRNVENRKIADAKQHLSTSSCQMLFASPIQVSVSKNYEYLLITCIFIFIYQ